MSKLNRFASIHLTTIAWIYDLNYRLESQSLMYKTPKEDATDDTRRGFEDRSVTFDSMVDNGWSLDHPCHVVERAWAVEHLGVTGEMILESLRHQYKSIDPIDDWLQKIAKKVKYIAVFGYCRSLTIVPACKEAERDVEEELIPVIVRQLESKSEYDNAQTAENEGVLAGRRTTSYVDKFRAAWRRVYDGMPIAHIRPYTKDGKRVPSEIGLEHGPAQHVQGLVYLAQAFGVEYVIDLLTRKENPLNPRKFKGAEIVNLSVEAETVEKDGKSWTAIEKPEPDAIQSLVTGVEDAITTRLTGKAPSAVKSSVWKSTKAKCPKTCLWERIRKEHLAGDGFENLSDVWTLLTASKDRLFVLTKDEAADLIEAREVEA